jgi:hypothetical protein
MDWDALTDKILPVGPVPDCPPGWSTGPPDFVGIGAQRAGTSRWYRLIRSHPNVAEGPKEHHFFDRFWGRTNHDIDRYQLFFPRPPGSICGEWTPRYMADHWTPGLLAQAAPETKLLVSLRDPVDRYISGLGLLAVQQRDWDVPITQTAPGDTVYRGAYRIHLQHVLKYFDRQQLLVLQFERCISDPDAELRRTFEFLGLDPELRAKDQYGMQTRSLQDQYPLPDRERSELVARYEPEVAALARDFPEIDLGLWPNFRHLA